MSPLRPRGDAVRPGRRPRLARCRGPARTLDPGGVVARDGQPGQHRPDRPRRARGGASASTRPAGSGPAARRRRPGSRTGRPRRPPAGRASGGRAGSARRRPRAPTTITPTTAATQRWRTWAAVDVGEGREERAVHQRPVGEDQRRVGRRDVRPEQQQRERGRGRERGEQREPLAARRGRRSGPGSRPGRSGRPAAPTSAQRRGEVRRDRLAAVAEADRLAPEPRLEPDEADRRERRPQDRAPVAVVDGRPGRRARGSRTR